MSKVLLTGFTPFEGRDINASWVAARVLKEHLADDRVSTLEMPVIWGRPRQLLEPLCKTDCPNLIIALGEGRPGWFDIETRANKAPAPRLDNDGNMRGEHPYPGGPAKMCASIDASRLQRDLQKQGIPARISIRAGGFLCEETLYTLESLKGQYRDLQTVVFVHLPPYGTPLHFRNQQTICDHTALLKFGRALFEAVAGIHGTVSPITTLSVAKPKTVASGASHISKKKR